MRSVREAGDPGRRFVFASVTIPVNKYSSSRVPPRRQPDLQFHTRAPQCSQTSVLSTVLCPHTLSALPLYKNLHSALLSPRLSLLPPSQIPEPHPNGSHYLYSPVPLPSFPLCTHRPLLSSCKVALHVRACAEAYSASHAPPGRPRPPVVVVEDIEARFEPDAHRLGRVALLALVGEALAVGKARGELLRLLKGHHL